MKLKPDLIRLSSVERLHQCPKPIIGLTGGIGSGKSSVARLLQQQGLLVIDADDLVHRIYDEQEARDYLSSLHPEAIGPQGINFQVLRKAAFNQPNLLEQLEQFVYSKLPHFFRREVDGSPQEFVVYDVPLLFEKKLNHQCDFTVCVYCTPEQQLTRAQARDTGDPETIKAIIAKQMPLKEKADLCDYVIDNSGNQADLEQATLTFLRYVHTNT